jgi:hypothetical protein
MFLKSVNRRKKPQEKLEVVVKETNGEIFNENEEVVQRWSKYSESLLIVDNDTRAKLTSVGIGGVTIRNVRHHNVISRKWRML